MEKNRSTKIIAIAALFIAVIGLSIGFAAFSSTLTISSSATVTPNDSTWKLGFGSTTTAIAAEDTEVAGVQTVPTQLTADTTAIPGNVTLNGTTATGINPTFTAPGQTVTYTFYAVNEGQLKAYLKGVTFGKDKTCTVTTEGVAEADRATAALVQEACAGISITVAVDGKDYNYSAATQTVSTGNAIAVSGSHTVVVTVAYASGAAYADGPFTVDFGTVSLNYDAVNYAGSGN